MIEVLRQAIVDQPLRRAAGDGDPRSAMVSHNNATRARGIAKTSGGGRETVDRGKKNETGAAGGGGGASERGWEGGGRASAKIRIEWKIGRARSDDTIPSTISPRRDRTRNELIGEGGEARGDAERGEGKQVNKLSGHGEI